jgi:uncharacterized FAD-dependent dehydrogenase
MKYDVAIIGSGPASLFAAMEIVNRSDLNVIVLEKARRLNDSRNVSIGWLGGSARASVKMFLDAEFGGDVATQALIEQFVDRLEIYGTGSTKPSKKKLLKRSIKMAEAQNIIVDEPSTISYSEDRMIKLGDFLYSHLREHATVMHKINISEISKEKGVFKIATNEGVVEADSCIIGIGRGGANWLINENKLFDLSYEEDFFDLGIRLEFPSHVIKDFADRAQNFRFRFNDFKTTLPVFMGTVETEEIGEIRSSNGRAWNAAKTPMVNIGVLKRFFTKRPMKDVYRLSEIVNVLSDGQLLREPLSRILKHETMISHLPEFREIVEGLEPLLNLFPNLKRRCTVYAPETRLNSIRFNLSPYMESGVNNLYIVGDMSGWTSSFVQAACSGLLAANGVLLQ